MTDLAALTRLCPPPEQIVGVRWETYDGTLTAFLTPVLSGRIQVPQSPHSLLDAPARFTPSRPALWKPELPCDVQPVGTATIRSWARANGYAVPSRGRVPRSGGSPRRTEPGARAVGRLAWTAEDSCQGTLVTVTPGMKSRRLLSQRAEWLWRRFSHQWPTTYSGTKTATTSWGPARRMERTYSTAGLVISR
ncbi:hypothetical protein DKG34_05980 [Streptomyces sp. NWU49]|nr:hypothetical protein DKG34_05980 [Streptomyces sp. NWU49]